MWPCCAGGRRSVGAGKGFESEIPPSPHHRYNTNSVGIIHTLSRGGGRGGVTDEGLMSDYGIGHG